MLHALFWGFLAAMLATLIFGLAVRTSGTTPKAFLAGLRPVANLIGTPNLFSVIVAVLAGIVGAGGLAAQRRIWTSRR